MEFFDWNLLGSFAGAVFAVSVLTQITKGIPGIVRIPTQLWSYLLSLATLILAQVFTAGICADAIVLAIFNAALISLASNGGYEALVRMKEGSGVQA